MDIYDATALSEKVVQRLKDLIEQEAAYGESHKYSVLLKKIKFFRKSNVVLIMIGFVVIIILFSRHLLMIPELYIFTGFFNLNLCNVSFPTVIIFSKYILPEKTNKIFMITKPFLKRSSTSSRTKTSHEPKVNFVSIAPSALIHPN
eukprot:snap_masked-scaffold_33-processed-gene-1.14-mRNA-1 protein AED:1.00 eAED:1.00 QI:0/0/0/0/1/1/2/0/145